MNTVEYFTVGLAVAAMLARIVMFVPALRRAQAAATA
jgi:hypothetical protein